MRHTILASPADTQRLRHAPTTILLHWLTALLVAVLWCIGQTVDWAPAGVLRVDYRSVHILLGMILGCVLVARLAWRTAKGGMLPPLDTGPLLVIARMTHWALYALLLVALGLGVTNVWARGDVIFNLFTLPQLIPGDHGFIHQMESWHALAANAVLIVTGLHAAAALFHHAILRDATLRRMLPWVPR